MDVENRVLVEIKRLRKELSEAVGSLQMGVTDESFREQLQDTPAKPTTAYGKLAAILVKQEQCGCECCIDGARMYADFQVSYHPMSDTSPSTDPREGGA